MNRHRKCPKGNKGARQATQEDLSRLSRSERLRRNRKRRRAIWWSGVGATTTGTVLAMLLTGGSSSVVHIVTQRLSPSTTQRVTAEPHASRASVRNNGNRRGGRPDGRRPVPLGPALQLVSAYPLDSWEVQAWIFPREVVPTPTQIGQLEKDDGSLALVNQDLFEDGADPPFTDTQLIVRNNRRYPVTISDIRVSASCQAPRDGAIFVGQNHIIYPDFAQSGQQLGVIVDSANPEARITNGWNVSQWTQEYVTGPLVTIQAGATYEFDIRAISLHYACTFEIVLTVVDGAKTYPQIFNDYGQPFRISALLANAQILTKPVSHPYAGYSMLYVGADASPWHDGTWVRENPRTWSLT
jgi:hypothetical protein